MKIQSRRWGFAAVVMSLVSGNAIAALPDELTAAEQNQVLAGSQVERVRDVAGKPWPEMTIYFVVDSSPEETAAVFHDYDRHMELNRSLTRSRVSRQLKPSVVEVDYILNVPFPGTDEWYTTRNTLAEKDGEISIVWELVKARSTQASNGFMKFTAWKGKTLVKYFNFVVPGQSLAGLFRGRAMKEVRDLAETLSDRVVDLKKTDPSLLSEEVKALKTALSSTH